MYVFSKDESTVSLSWNSIGNVPGAGCVSGSAVSYIIPEEYQVKVNGETVGCVTGSAIQYTFAYPLPDRYTTYEYQVSSIGKTEEETIHSNVVSYTNVKRVSGTISEDTVWGADAGSYEITGNLTIAKDATLYIKPGTILRFASNANFCVNGNVIVDGDEGNEVVFTSLYDAEYGGDEGASVYWGGVRVNEGGVLKAEYTKFRNMQGSYIKESYHKEYLIENIGYYYIGFIISGESEIINSEINVNNHIPEEYSTRKINGTTFKVIKSSYADAVEVNGKGSLYLLNSTVTSGQCSALIVLTNENSVVVEESNIEANESAFVLKHSGNAIVAISESSLCEKKDSTVNAGGETGFYFTGNTVSGGNYTLFIESLGSGEFVLKENEFVGAGNYPVYISVAYMTTDRLEQIYMQNGYTGYRQANAPVIGGVLDGDLILVKRNYVTNGITVNPGGVLTIEAGAELYCLASASITIFGKANLIGTQECPILISGFGEENAWEGIVDRTGETEGVCVEKGGVFIAEYVKFRKIRSGSKYVNASYHHSGIYVFGYAALTYCDIDIQNTYDASYSSYKVMNAIEVHGNGILELKNSIVNVGGTDVSGAVIEVSNSGGEVIVKDSILSGNRSGFVLNQTGTTLVSFNGVVIDCDKVSTINSIEESSIEFVNNKVFGGKSLYSVYINTLGSGSFSFVENEFVDGLNYPIYVDMRCLTEERINQLSQKNNYSGFAVNVVFLGGTIVDEKVIPAGQYASTGITVNSGAVLTLNEAEIYFSSDASLNVYGEAKLIGTEEHSCVIGGFFDSVCEWQNMTNSFGCMEGVRVHEGGTLEADYVDFRNIEACRLDTDIKSEYDRYSGIYVYGDMILKNCNVDVKYFIHSSKYKIEAIRVWGKGTLKMDNSTVKLENEGGVGTVIDISTIEGNVIIRDCMLEGKCAGFSLNHSGTARVSIIGTTIIGSTDSTIRSSDDSDIEFVGNTIFGGQYSVFIDRFGNGALTVVENEFIGGTGYPIYLNIAYSTQKMIEDLSQKNSFRNYDGANALVITGIVTDEKVIPAGRYVSTGITVDRGATLSINEAEIYFSHDAHLDIYGKMESNGTKEKTCVISGFNDNTCVWEEITDCSGYMEGVRIYEGGILEAEYTKFRNMQG